MESKEIRAAGRLVMVNRGEATINGETRPLTLLMGVVAGHLMSPESMEKDTNELWEVEIILRPRRIHQTNRFHPKGGGEIIYTYLHGGDNPENWETCLYDDGSLPPIERD